jgi:hypothetical protein
MWCETLLCAALLAAEPKIPELTDDQRQRLAHANDGADHHEEAFLALTEHVRTWSQTSAAAAPIAQQLINDPSTHRGELFLVTGTIAQRELMSPPFDDVSQWFVRDADDRPLLIFVVNASSAATRFRDGDPVEIVARFYKRIDFIARDGLKRSYPAFVGAWPRAPTTIADAGTAASPMWYLAGPVAMLLIIFTVLMLWVRRNRRGALPEHRPLSHRADDSLAQVDTGEPLPDDPAAALAELKRRAAAIRSTPADSHAPH